MLPYIKSHLLQIQLVKVMNKQFFQFFLCILLRFADNIQM